MIAFGFRNRSDVDTETFLYNIIFKTTDFPRWHISVTAQKRYKKVNWLMVNEYQVQLNCVHICVATNKFPLHLKLTNKCHCWPGSCLNAVLHR